MNKKKVPLVIIGGGGHARVIISIIEKLEKYQVLGYVDLAKKRNMKGIKYLGRDKILKSLKKKHRNCQAIIGIGKVDLGDFRLKIYNRLKALGFEFPAIVSPQASVNKEVLLGPGTVVGDKAVINCGVKIQALGIINTGSIIEHDCKLGENVSVAPGAILCGEAMVGDNSFIGAGAVVNQVLNIAKNCLIGSGAVVVKNCPTAGTYLGIPAKKVKN
ncbi:acetyltransferase [Patescibacteria group bacterium]|nr:acetyltransferase [Patescibacteria group bacterium]